MKKVLLFLLLLVSVQTFAQIRRTAEFDFTKPTALTPSITPMTENAQTVQVTDETFKNSAVSISFTPVGVAKGARIQTIVEDGVTSYLLRLESITDMTFQVANGATLNEISFSNETVFGGLYLRNGEAGAMDPYETYKKWEAGSATNVNSVTFRNSDKDALFYKIYVTYTEPSDVLAPTSTSIQQGSTVASFSALTLRFADNMILASTNGITLSNGTKTWNMSATVSKDSIILSAPEEISTDGTYTVTVPARCFKNASGYENQALSYTFTVSTPKNSFNFSSVTPAEGNVDSLPSKITLTYPTYIKVNETATLTLCENGKNIAPVTIFKKTGDSKSAVLSFADVIAEGITTKGKYTITVPENTITDGMGETYNPTFTLTYTIGETTPDPTPDPDPDPTPEDTETMKLAKKLVETTGVGFPKADSETRNALKALIEAETTPSDEDLLSAIDTLYKDTDVELPSEGKWYIISGVNNNESNATHAYLSYTDGKVTLTTNKNVATAFEVENHGASYAFKTKDGKYLHVLSSNNVDYEGTSDKNVTSDYSSVNNLTLAKLSVAEVETSKQFGLLTIEGSLGKDVLENIAANAFALIAYGNDNLTIRTRANFTVQFSETLSSAFSLEETSEPDEETQTVETAYTITPSTVEKGGDLTLTFPNVENIKASSEIDAYIANASGERIEGISVISSADSNNKFTISISGFDNGNYQVVFPEGSFLYQKNGKTVQTQLIKADFTIGNGGSGEDEDSGNDGKFTETYDQFIVMPSVNSEYIKDSDLNNFTISIINGDYSGLVPDPSKTVRIAKYSNNATMATGHFEACSEDEQPGYTVIKLVLDSPIAEGSFASTKYSVVVESGTFGDANFGKYLADKSSVSAKSCRVNARRNFDYVVNNDMATGIDEVTTDANRPSVIYDLMGRRVQDMSRPGIYIVNGKKIVKK